MTATSMTNGQYEQFVEEQFVDAAQVRKRIVFTNRGPFHAQAVLTQMVSRAASTIKIVSACLHDGIFRAETLRDAAKRGVSVQVILTDELPLRGATAIAHLREESERGLVQVRQRSGNLRVPHFVITDGVHLRSEKDQIENTAVIVLNADLPVDEALSKGYTDYFDTLWEQSTVSPFTAVMGR